MLKENREGRRWPTHRDEAEKLLEEADKKLGMDMAANSVEAYIMTSFEWP